jgi:very-short-patch-repair endonuclease
MMRIKIIPYNPNLKEKARELRNNSTLGEVLLWNKLKRRQMKGYQFLRQKPLDHYIVDFFSPDLNLAIEIDGNYHMYKLKDDTKRQKRLESYGIKFLRFRDEDVKKNIRGVLQKIEDWIKAQTASPGPLQKAI